ncbi:putative alpha-glycosyltransferase/ family 4 [Synechococcus sp. A18-40]|nr:putative alpha-glycosyltransferase/ family 4 [Synechococcus sp. A18-40]
MRVGFDRQTFTIQKYGGVSRYFTDLYLGLSQSPEIEAELLFTWHQNAYLTEHGIGRNLHPLAAKCYIKGLSHGNFELPLSKKHDIHHSTFYLGRPKKQKGNTRLITTLYDMIPETFPGFKEKKVHANKLDWLNSSDLIVSISDSSAEDLAYLQPHLAERIRKIHLYSGFSKESVQTKPAAILDNDNPYHLFVGNRRGYKNADMLFRAFAASEPKRHRHYLLMAGGGTLLKEEQDSITRLGIGDCVKQVNVSDSELWYLYKNAASVLVPSMAEGFSLPLVEGLVADAPILCSDISIHREVAGQFATLVNPLNYQDWADILLDHKKMKSPSEKISEKDYKDKCNYYNRERMIADHIKLYKSIA